MALEQIGLLERDEKRDLFVLLKRLDPRERLDYLAWACREAGRNRPDKVTVTSSTGTERDVWGDLMSLTFAYDLDPRAALAELVRRVRRLGR